MTMPTERLARIGALFLSTVLTTTLWMGCSSAPTPATTAKDAGSVGADGGAADVDAGQVSGSGGAQGTGGGGQGGNPGSGGAIVDPDPPFDGGRDSGGGLGGRDGSVARDARPDTGGTSDAGNFPVCPALDQACSPDGIVCRTAIGQVCTCLMGDWRCFRAR